MLGLGVNLELQKPVAVEKVCRYRGKRVICARQRGEEIVDSFVMLPGREIADVKLCMSGHDHRFGPTTAFGEKVDQETLHAIGRGCTNVHPITSSRIKLVALPNRGSLEDTCAAPKREKVTKWVVTCW